MVELVCPICNNKCNQGERYCNECGSVERHRALVNLYKNKKIGDATGKNVLIVSEGKRDNGKYYETSYYFSKISVLTTLDIMDHTTYFKDTQRYDIYNRLENMKSINDNSFDYIICNHVLTAVEYDLTALAELSRVLKKNGIFVISDGIDHNVTESFIANKGQYTRRHYSKNNIMKILSDFFDDVSLVTDYDDIYKKKTEFLICKDNKKNIKKMGLSVSLPNEGWWKHIVIVFSLSRCGSSSLEIALQNLGYDTVNIDPGRAKRDNKVKEYDQVLLNIKQNKPVFENVNKKYNAFILGNHYSNNITKIIEDYPGIKIICCVRDDDTWVISMKNHQLVANRPNPKREDLINRKNNFLNNITTQIEQNKFTDNLLLFNVSNGDGYKELCNFLHKDIPNSNYPHISTNRKLTLTQEQIDF